MLRSPIIACVVTCLMAWGTAESHGEQPGSSPQNAAALDFFERKIRPVLVEHCYQCHSKQSDLLQGGLRVDEPSAMLRGGDSGTIISPGKPAASLLVSVLRYDAMEMPPDQPLPEAVIQDFEKWVQAGAVMPDSQHDVDVAVETMGRPVIDWEKAKRFWAFQNPTLHRPSKIQSTGAIDSSWPSTKIDQFVNARLAIHGLAPNEAASKRVWIRRVTFDLIGLPPTPSEVAEFLADESPFAKEKVVDRLLASERNAERWARIWLDVARFAEDQAHIVGKNDSLTYPNAYLYRNWVIKALAADMPYDQFVKLQLAADLITPDADSSLAALGFIGLGPKYYRRNSLEVMADEWEDRVDIVTRGLLGLTVACARCHDHKYDPIPTSDYYALASIFASTEMFNRPLDESVELKDGQAKKPQDAMHIVREGEPQDLNVMIRGDAKRLGPPVKRGFLSVLQDDVSPEIGSGSGRSELADAIVSAQNPLAARVIVNRIWGQLMGVPLVATPSNFGSLGAPPTHPLLLDDLSVRFMNSGWSLKWLEREIVLSATYGLSSDVDDDKLRIDPENQFRWRMPRRRLSIESYRDAILSVSRGLVSELGGHSIDPQDPKTNRRTVYSKVSRLDLDPMLAKFDFPDPNAHSAGRHETTTPLQKLFLLNSPFMAHHAAELAHRIRGGRASDAEAITKAYQQLYARCPTDQELQLAERYVADGGIERWTELAQVLLISNEMFTLD